MFPFTVQNTLFQDGADARAQALLQQHQRLSLPSLVASGHGLSASELTRASSLQNQEAIASTAELLKRSRQHQQKIGQQDQLAAAIALVSRSQAITSAMQPQRNQTQQQQQQNHLQQEELLKRAISQFSGIPRHCQPLHHHIGTQHKALPTPDNNQDPRRGNNSLYCAEDDLSQEKDICFGRGQRVQRRKANVAFRKIVATYQETYDQAVSREDKKAVVKKVSRIFSRTGYRFFKESESIVVPKGQSKMWIAVSDHHVEYKIGHSFRSGRKQLKQQKKLQKRERESSDASVGSNDSQTEKKRTPPIVAKDSGNSLMFKEDQLSDKCICIGDEREKYTGMEAYQYFREFVLTFKSIFGMSESGEKVKIVSSLIDQVKSRKGYRFLKLMPLKKDIEFWVEASVDEIQREVFSILGDKKAVPSADAETIKQANENQVTEDELSTKDGTSMVIESKEKKRSSDSIDSEKPLKKRRIVPVVKQEENCSPTDDTKAIVSDMESAVPSKVAKKTALEQLAIACETKSSSSLSTATKLEETGDSNSTRETGKKTQSQEGSSLVPSEIICKRDASVENSAATTPKAENSKGEDVHVPQSLTLPSVFSGTTATESGSSGLVGALQALRGNQSIADIASRQNILQGKVQPGFDLSTIVDWGARSTLEKALVAMGSSANGEKPLETAKEFERKAKILHHLQQQELLYIEKKHKLAMLDLQMQSRNCGV